nr:nucleotidyltransferase family protein [Micromonospora globispora]
MIRKTEPGGPQATELAELIASSAWFLNVLTAVRDAGLPDAWVGAGALRDLVWGQRYGGGFDPQDVRDVDVAFFDPTAILPRHCRSAHRSGWTTCSMAYGGATHDESPSSCHEPA